MAVIKETVLTSSKANTGNIADERDEAFSRLHAGPKKTFAFLDGADQSPAFVPRAFAQFETIGRNGTEPGLDTSHFLIFGPPFDPTADNLSTVRQ